MSESDKFDAARYGVFCGLQVGKSEHRARALATDGTKVQDKPVPNDEPALVAVLTALQTRGQVLVIVDQPASIGAHAIAVARSLSIDVAYLPGLAMRRIVDLYPGEGKTDARDAFVIANAMPHTLRRVGTDDETLAGLGVLAGYDDDLAAQSTRLTNRLRDALLHVHPALKRLLDRHLDRGGVLDVLVAAPTPTMLNDLGADGIKKCALMLAASMVGIVLTATPALATTEQALILSPVNAHSRPHVSDDNPYSEAQFKTLKYLPNFPARFVSRTDAREFCAKFFHEYKLRSQAFRGSKTCCATLRRSETRSVLQHISRAVMLVAGICSGH